MKIDLFDRKGASDSQYTALSAFRNRLRAERLPSDPPIPLDEHIRRWRDEPPFVEVQIWTVSSDDGAHVIAAGDVVFYRTFRVSISLAG